MRVIILGLCGLVAGFALMPVASGMSLLLVATALLAGGFGLCNPALNSLISRRAPTDSQGAALGVAQSGASLARILGPAFAGAVFSLLGRHAPYIIGALLLLFALGIAWRMMQSSDVDAAEQ